MAKSEDLGAYYRVPMDCRDLNYSNSNSHGNEDVTESAEYSSHSTHRLDTDELKGLILELPFIKSKLANLKLVGDL